MSVLYSIIAEQYVYATEDNLPERRTMYWEGMLVEVLVYEEQLILNRLIDAPLHHYLNEKYTPGAIVQAPMS